MRLRFGGLFIGSVACSYTCNALLALDAKHCSSKSFWLPLKSYQLLHPRFCNNNRTTSCMMASSSKDTSDGSNAKQSPTHRKRTVRVTTSKRSLKTTQPQRIRTRRKTTTMASPKMTSLNNKRKSTESTADKEVNVPIKIPYNLASGATFQRNEMMEHTLLTKEEEFEYGRCVVHARELREKVESYVEEMNIQRELRKDEHEKSDGGDEVDIDFLSYELEYLSLYGFRPGKKQEYDLEDDLLIDHAQHRTQHLNQLKNGGNEISPKKKRRSGYRHESSSSMASNNSYTSLLHIPIHQLTDQDLIILGVPGGKAEAIEILLQGAHAREVLMRRNIKLVISIAKNWMRNSFTTENANLGGSRANKKRMSQIFDGSWDRPSLDEAVQEGVLGLARAVDKYDPERGLRFSTYATHWVTSYVRVCFQRAVTGCLRVPSQLHDIKSAYKRIVKDHYLESQAPPEMKSIAKQLGITEQRLNTAIQATSSLISVDAPVILPGSGSYKGSAAGGDGGSNQELLILDTLRCVEPRPEDQVEISFLRQCLENAMATELTPYERDILRLRLGLDSGEGKTVRQIVEICGGSVTTADIRAAERRAFKKLRSPTSVHTHNLLAYLENPGADRDFLLRR